MKVLLANPRGFCAGVEKLKAKGAIFLDDISDVPVGATLIFSAHGVSQEVRKLAAQRQFNLFDATCPLVTKVHMEVARYAKRNIECILIGHAGHPEVEGTMGQYHNPDAGVYLIETIDDVFKLKLKNPDQCAYVTQTTLSVNDTVELISALKMKFPKMTCPKKDDICYATTNRQEAVTQLAKLCDVMIVIGSIESSNSNRLKELAERLGCKSYLLDDASIMQREWFANVSVLGVTAG